MKRYTAKKRYDISKSQEELLLGVMKYRFVSTDILAETLGKDRSTIYERLSVLVDQGYVLKQYDKSFRFRQRPVIYTLAPAGIRHLNGLGVERTKLHYKNKSFTDEQIDEQLRLGKIARAVHKPYGNRFTLHTKYQLGPDDFYLTPPPFAKLVGKTEDTPDYFIEYFPPLYETWKIRKRINQHLEYADEHDEYAYPHLLLVCGNESTLKRVVRLTADTLADFEIFCTTLDQIHTDHDGIWLKPEDADWEEKLEYQSLPLQLDN